MSELKLCPFCGGEAKYVKDFDHNIIGVECQTKDCFAYLKQYSESRAAWNTRSTPDLSAVKEKVEAIRGKVIYHRAFGINEDALNEIINDATAALALLDKGGSDATR